MVNELNNPLGHNLDNMVSNNTFPLSSPAIYISQYSLTSSDLPRIEKDLKAGKILFLKTSGFFTQFEDNVLMLKSTIEELKKIVATKRGTIGRIGSDILVLTPHNHVKLL
jgi:SepF-like predicted cell division protein (DUF552 family)